MHFQLCIATVLLFYTVQAYNPFEGAFPRMKCVKGRTLRGCNETLLEAYKKSNLSASDQNFNDAETYMMLYTRDNKKRPEYLDECGARLPRNTRFNASINTVIILHGYLEGVCQAAYMREMKDQLLFRAEYNVILFDFSWGNQIDYYDSVRNADVVAKQGALLIKNIVEETGYSLDKIHIIGHSLGAQVAGRIGQVVQAILGGIIRRISALDPAGPGYQNSVGVDRSDAKMVDIIHANGGPCLPSSFGYFPPTGHADFYPNGGSTQLSCRSNIVNSFLKGDIFYATASLLPGLCSHKQSVQYFKASINACNCQLIGVRCRNYEEFESGACRSCGADGSNCEVMGMDWEEYPRREGNNSYYLNTAYDCPYCDNSGIKREKFPLQPTTGRTLTCFP